VMVKCRPFPQAWLEAAAVHVTTGINLPVDESMFERIGDTWFRTDYTGDTSLEVKEAFSAFISHDDRVCVGGYVFGEEGFACYHRAYSWNSEQAENVREMAKRLNLAEKTTEELEFVDWVMLYEPLRQAFTKALREFYHDVCYYPLSQQEEC